MLSRSLLFLALCALVRQALAYVPSDATRYAPGMNVPGVKIADKPEYSIANFTRQWRATLELSKDGKPFVVHRCNGTTWGAACNANDIVTQKSNHLVRVNFTRTDASVPLRTYRNWPVKYLIVRLDIMVATAADRGWRKKNGLYPKYGQHVLVKSDQLPADLTSGSVVFDMNKEDELPKVVLYPEVCAVCTKPDGAEEYCQCDRWNTPANAISFETDAIMGITSGMRAAAIILSIISPAIFFAYWIADHLYYKKTGRPLGLF